MKNWNLESWKKYPVGQHPGWNKHPKINQIKYLLAKSPPLVFKNEIITLKKRLADVQDRKYYIVQGGDCAETFADFNAEIIRNKLNILLQMSIVLSYGTSKKTLRIGRIAGQFAKPRTKQTEIIDNIELPTYRGDAINSIEYNSKSRTPNPTRMMKAYEHASYTMNMIRSIINGGYTNIKNANDWDLEFIKSSDQGKKYHSIIDKILKAISFIDAVDNDRNKNTQFELHEFYTSHEGLLLDYEQGLTRYDYSEKKYYDYSGHMIWVGDRTRNIDGAHIEFLSGIENPIGIKIGPSIDDEELIEIINKVNPNNERCKIILIARLGIDNIDKKLPLLIRKIKKNKMNVVWLCDPMHGNTFNNQYGYKTRHFNTILNELEKYVNIHKSQNSFPGGIHIEFTGEDVTECLGGFQNINDNTLMQRYETACDPRLNNKQSLELIFKLTDLLNKGERDVRKN